MKRRKRSYGATDPSIISRIGDALVLMIAALIAAIVGLVAAFAHACRRAQGYDDVTPAILREVKEIERETVSIEQNDGYGRRQTPVKAARLYLQDKPASEVYMLPLKRKDGSQERGPLASTIGR
jgi:hypothetical protein